MGDPRTFAAIWTLGIEVFIFALVIDVKTKMDWLAVLVAGCRVVLATRPLLHFEGVAPVTYLAFLFCLHAAKLHQLGAASILQAATQKEIPEANITEAKVEGSFLHSVLCVLLLFYITLPSFSYCTLFTWAITQVHHHGH